MSCGVGLSELINKEAASNEQRRQLFLERKCFKIIQDSLKKVPQSGEKR